MDLVFSQVFVVVVVVSTAAPPQQQHDVARGYYYFATAWDFRIFLNFINRYSFLDFFFITFASNVHKTSTRGTHSRLSLITNLSLQSYLFFFISLRVTAQERCDHDTTRAKTPLLLTHDRNIAGGACPPTLPFQLFPPSLPHSPSSRTVNCAFKTLHETRQALHRFYFTLPHTAFRLLAKLRLLFWRNWNGAIFCPRRQEVLHFLFT